MTDYTNTSQQEMEVMHDLGWALLQFLAGVLAAGCLLALWFLYFYGV